ncbi:MAG: hypothetical protein WC390_06400 [Sulfurimonas sp.]|jgi:hypothetical protein
MQNNLTISVDACYAFDYLAILVIKNQKRLIRYDVVEDCKNFLIGQIGRNKFVEIMQSQEFENLCQVNSKTFDLVEEARKEDDGLANKVDAANMDRYHAKVALQKSFFSSEPSIEKKS